MLSDVIAMCGDCGGERTFVPIENGCEFCCTSCDAAVYLLDVLENTGTPQRRVA